MTPPTDETRRCDSENSAAVRCELTADHGWIHAAQIEGRLWRWDHTGRCWRIETPAGAVIAARLPWWSSRAQRCEGA